MIVYLDTSAVAKLLAVEAETEALAAHLDQLSATDVVLVSAVLLETELRRMAARIGVTQVSVTEILLRIALIEMDRGMFRDAGLIPGEHLRSLDALHVVVAQRAGAEEFITYDDRQALAARELGLRVAAPGVARI